MTAPQPTRTKLGTARATITTDRYHTELRARRHQLAADEPPPHGADTAPTPTETTSAPGSWTSPSAHR